MRKRARFSPDEQSCRPRFLFLGNGGHYNRGCEAIERGTVEILRATFESFSVESLSSAATLSYDESICGEARRQVRYVRLSRKHPARVVPGFLRRSGIGKLVPGITWKAATPWLREVQESARRADAVLLLGGDNYTLDYGRPDYHMALVEAVLSCGTPLVLWGCSVGPFDKDKRLERAIADRLRRMALILPREDHTVEYLRSVGVAENVHRVADPAFVMPPVVPKLAGFEVPPGSIGINISPLVGRYAGLTPQEWMDAVVESTKLLLRQTGRHVVLIPHVIAPKDNDDYQFLVSVRQRVGSQRLSVAPRELRASELKHIIGQCDFFIGARTHATIAALSQAVPCGFIAYSQKAYGLAQDLIGSSAPLIDVRDWRSESLAELVSALEERSGDLRRRLSSRIPDVVTLAQEAGRFLAGALDSDV